MVQVVYVLVGIDNEMGDRLLDQRASGNAQKGGGGEVGFQNQPLFAERDIADRRQIVEVEITRPRGVQFLLRTAKFFVLDLQLDLVHAQFVEHPPDFFGRQGLDVFR